MSPLARPALTSLRDRSRKPRVRTTGTALAALFALALVTFVAGVGASAEAADWTVDFSQTHSNANLRPLHGVNGGPLCYRGVIDLTARHRELGIPLTRLHDTVWVNAEAVDVHTIFRDPRADPQEPGNYDFRATDDYLRAVIASGAQITYRLGESIEHTPRQYWVNPPPDPDRWAAVCLGIVRHYQEGWAEGLQKAVKYWEIWNEPDVRPAMWTGTDDEFLRLFEVTAKTLKAKFPNLHVGGPGLGQVGTLTNGVLTPTPFTLRFLNHCKTRNVPLDFFSWHRYSADPDSFPRLAHAVRQLLRDHGFTETESHLNEWNYLPADDWTPMLKDGQGPPREAWYARMHGPEGAAFAAGVLLRLQDAPVDAANYYTGEIQGFGLFTYNGTPKKTFHAFRLFRELLETPVRVPIELEGTNAPPTGMVLYAGRNLASTAGAVLVANQTRGDLRIGIRLVAQRWGDNTRWETLVVDDRRDGTVLEQGTSPGGTTRIMIRVPGPGAVLLRLKGGGA